MEILLALAAAVSYGVSDFAGGVLTRRAHVFVVYLLPQLVSFALLLMVVACRRTPSRGRGWAGAAAGLAGVVGTSLLYQGQAIGRMSVVAPSPWGERPGPAALAGIVLGLVAAVARVRRTPICRVRVLGRGPSACCLRSCCRWDLPFPADCAPGDARKFYPPSHLARSCRSASNASCSSRWAISLRRHHRVSRTWSGGTSRLPIISSWGCQGSSSTRAHQRLW
jgi:hypothetical protein